MELLLILILVLLLLGGGWTSRPGWTGPEVSGFLWLLVAVVVIILIVRLLGVL